jgi:hypothetical protein
MLVSFLSLFLFTFFSYDINRHPRGFLCHNRLRKKGREGNCELELKFQQWGRRTLNTSVIIRELKHRN